MPITRRLVAPAILAAATALAATAAHAQETYPSKPITIVVPYGAGGGTDYFVRTILPKMTEKLGQPIVVENKPGAGTAIAAADVARARPDGYRILIGDIATFSTNRFLYRNLPYDAERDFVPITMAGRSPFFLLVNPKFHPQKTMDELIVAIKAAKPGTISYGSAGNGGPMHLTGEMFVRAAGLDMIHVPYKGSAPAIPDMLNGQISMIFMDYAPAKALIDGGTLKALATSSPSEMPVQPGVPPVASKYPGFETWFWIAFAAPRGTPAPVIEKFREAYNAAVDDPETRKKLEQAGISPMKTSGAEMGAYMKSEADRFGKIIEAAGIRLD